MPPYLRLLRPHQWVKNGFVLAPLIFAGKLLHVPSLILGFSAFAIFCLASSSVYAFNDIFDREHDRYHPRKRYRPVASGVIGVLKAAFVGTGLFVDPKTPISIIDGIKNYLTDKGLSDVNDVIGSLKTDSR